MFSSRRSSKYGSVNQGLNARLEPRNSVIANSVHRIRGGGYENGVHAYYGRMMDDSNSLDSSTTRISSIPPLQPPLQSTGPSGHCGEADLVSSQEYRLKVGDGEAVFVGGATSWDDSLINASAAPSRLSGPFSESYNINNTIVPTLATNEPRKWGPAYWYSIHNASLYYPVKPSREDREELKKFIYGLPSMIPCVVCKTNARAFVKKNVGEIDNAVTSRENAFRFFVDFHNHANHASGKPGIGYDEASRLYLG